MNLIKCEKLEKSMAELQFSIDAEAFKGAVADVFKKEGKKYSVPGFRKGKAPRSLIEKMYGADVFTYDAINELFPEAFEAAVKEANVEPVGRPEVSVDAANETEGVTLTVKVAVKPEIKVGNYNGLTVEKTVHTVTDEAVDAELKRVQERNARELTREGAAQNGDIVDIDFEGFVDGVAFEGGKAEHYSLTLGSGTSAGQTELAKTGSGTPKLAVQSGSSTRVWVDHDTYTALGMSEDDLEEQLAALVSSESGTIEAVVGTQPGSSAENGTPVTVQPDDADGGDEDDGEESQPEEKTSRTGGDYFGNQKWAELKAQIAKAEDGDTLEMSGTGLPWFPSSVARALKGKDVTLEIRKNGVTYTLNGQKIGPITKIWYNFDENLETTLQPVEE